MCYQDFNIKTAFKNLNSLKRSMTLLTLERDKDTPSKNAINMHELHVHQAILKLELSMRAIQSEYRREAEEEDEQYEERTEM